MKPRVRDDLAVVELDGEAVVYDEDGGQLHHLNPTATVIFQMCDGTATVKEFSADIAEAYGLTATEIERQVRALLREFRKSGLLERKTQSNGAK
ncbi:MAG: HPr-rel-A system PqqD family peptide chaperone [Actinomycetota bacterium]